MRIAVTAPECARHIGLPGPAPSFRNKQASGLFRSDGILQSFGIFFRGRLG